MMGPPAILEEPSPKAVGGSQASVLAVADAEGFCSVPAIFGPSLTSPVVLASGAIATAAGSVLESFSLQPNGSLKPNWLSSDLPSIGDSVASAMAVDGRDGVWTVALNGDVHMTKSDATTVSVTTVGSSASGIVILQGDDAVIGDQSAKLRRMSATRMPPWTESSPLNGVPNTPMVVSGLSTQLIVPTSTGRLYAVRESDGGIAWSVKLSTAGAALQPANIHTPPGQPAGAVMSTAYVSGADGKLYAVVVDGQLDTAAPWPKAFHDPRNTNNAGTRP